MKRVIFIDRDGTIIREPEDEQVDSLEKLSFLPGAISALARIREETDYELVMVSNQDGLGTPSFPEETFWGAHLKMLEILEGEGVSFDQIFIDRTFPEQMAPTRKPGTAMLSGYLNGKYDLEGSFVIGDRHTDVELAKNLGCRAIYISQDHHEGAELCTSNWAEITSHLLRSARNASIFRTTGETSVQAWIDLEGTGRCAANTGIPFLDHMLDQIARHAGIDLSVTARGDLEVDLHHTVEDVALALGTVMRAAVGKGIGMGRYGFALPMDDCAAEVLLDIGGRPYFVWNAEFSGDAVGGIPIGLFRHFFRSLSDQLRCNLHITAYGPDDHHLIESIFKAFARALRKAVKKDVASNELPSTKGMIQFQ